MMNNRVMKTAHALFALLVFMGVGAAVANAQRSLETLDRGVVAVNQGDGQAFVSWRMLGTDSETIAFNLYRESGSEITKLNSQPITSKTCFVDRDAPDDEAAAYVVKAIIDGEEKEESRALILNPLGDSTPFLSIPMQAPDGTTPNDASVGDLDGDGDYEIVIHQASRGRDNSQSGVTGPAYLQAYTLEGDLLWTINLGPNIREGAHYTQFMVYDLDGDGRAEVACKTADGTIDGKGTVIGDADAIYRNENGYILAGLEYLTVFDGLSGVALATVDYIPPRHPDTLEPSPQQIEELWGDDYGNRADRFLACVAFLDGERPSLVMCRGYYTRTVLAAWNWRDGELSHVWTFDSDASPETGKYRGQGYHSVSVADVDNDGKDEIIYGACAIDDDGSGLYSTGLGHGDAMHLTDIDPEREGLELFGIHERPRHEFGANLRDAATGEVLWGLELEDPGRGLAIDIDPRFPGLECWTNDSDGLYSSQGERISSAKPRSCNMVIWWDGDLLRELLDGGRSGAFIGKWDYERGEIDRLLDGAEYDCVTNNGSKANPCLSADIFGDWREEVIWRTRDDSELRIFTTTHDTDIRMPTLMHDPVYRLSVAWQNVAYNQPPHPGFYPGAGEKTETGVNSVRYK